MEQLRHKAQQAFVESKQNIEIGCLDGVDITLNELKNTTEQSGYVLQSFTSGLTAIVYQLLLNGQHWTLKLKRPESLVKNIDGQTSFLNEVQRRRDLMILKQQNPNDFKHIVDTQFASFNDGIILSPWIEGEGIRCLNQDLFEQIFSSIVNLELHGLFEWDFCPGNILVDQDNNIKLFDFGYMYEFNPKEHFNSNGIKNALFHGVERFETRFFFDLLLKNPQQLSERELFELYKLEKQCALKAYQNKLNRLVTMQAEPQILIWQEQINNSWQAALSDDDALQALYLMDSFRSNVLDLLDDIHGQSCSPYTLKKADLILHILDHNFEHLNQKNGFFFGDEKLTQAQLISKYSQLREDAVRFQLSD